MHAPLLAMRERANGLRESLNELRAEVRAWWITHAGMHWRRARRVGKVKSNGGSQERGGMEGGEETEMKSKLVRSGLELRREGRSVGKERQIGGTNRADLLSGSEGSKRELDKSSSSEEDVTRDIMSRSARAGTGKGEVRALWLGWLAHTSHASYDVPEQRSL
eukprot:5838131-Pleurochrysis_carterae.AAC.1